MRVRALPLVTIAIVVAGIQLAHVAANALFGVPAGSDELFAVDELLPAVACACAVVFAAGLATRLLAPRAARGLAPRAAAAGAPVAFALLESIEALAGHASVVPVVESRTFLFGLALQIPVGLVSLAVARAALRLADAAADSVAQEARTFFAWSADVPAGAPRTPLRLRLLGAAASTRGPPPVPRHA